MKVRVNGVHLYLDLGRSGIWHDDPDRTFAVLCNYIVATGAPS